MPEAILIDDASIEDAADISAVLSANLADRGLYQESASRIARSFGDFMVARTSNGRIVGCASIHNDRSRLAQLHSVAVVPEHQGLGVGQKLVSAAVERAASAGIDRLWLATMKPDYFARHGFRPMSRWRLPASVLLRQVRKTLRQPVAHIPLAVIGSHTFMELRL